MLCAQLFSITLLLLFNIWIIILFADVFDYGIYIFYGKEYHTNIFWKIILSFYLFPSTFTIIYKICFIGEPNSKKYMNRKKNVMMAIQMRRQIIKNMEIEIEKLLDEIDENNCY